MLRWGIFIVSLLAGLLLTRPIMAQLPDPIQSVVVTPAPDHPPCHLTPLENCNFVQNRDQITPQTFPGDGEHGVGRHAWISMTFAEDMDPQSINSNTFLVRQGQSSIPGRVEYIPGSRMAIFKPDTSLEPNTTYQALITTGTKNSRGVELAGEIEWKFTTESPAGPPHFILAENVAAESMNVYIGDLHAHTGYSGGQGTPQQAFLTAQASGLDFFALTEHAYLLTEAEWQDVLTQATTSTVDGVFVGLRGFEFHHPLGHLNVFDSAAYVQSTDPNYDDLTEFYGWLVNHPTAFGQFNHPLPNFNFNNFAYDSVVDHKVVLKELMTGEQFFLSMNQGWHVGSLLNSDTHVQDWGCCPRMGVLASALTKEAILAGLRASRTFYVPANDRNFALILQANGQWMGSAVSEAATLNFIVQAHNPDPTGQLVHFVLYDNGIPVASTALPETTTTTWTPSIPATIGHYYYAEAYRAGWWVSAYSSPIWVERRPVAEAGPDQFVAPGMSVSLNGSGSSDGDGDALAYRWLQEGGTPAALNQANQFQAQASFSAPNVVEALTFRLAVTDSGHLSDTDTTTVTVTDKPILSLIKTGPAVAERGAPVTYTLAISNMGVTTATNVVITDVLPLGATYISGGTLMPGNIISWTLPTLPANSGPSQVGFVVTATGAIVNDTYAATCIDCIPAQGQVPVYTNFEKIYLPIIAK